MPQEPEGITHSASRVLSGQLPLDVLPPDAIERLREGGELTEEEMRTVRSAALRQSGTAGRLLAAAFESGLLNERKFRPVDTSDPALSAAPPDAALVPAGSRTWEWKWEHRPHDAEAAMENPQTFYELLSGEPDPHRDTFIAARRVLDVVMWTLALGIPIALVVLALTTGQSAETAFFFGVFGLIIGIMLRKSVPRPFG